ncbi:hypothetical protein AOQ84DRAFT_178356 [Glonium stellatum]|uniref:Mg2+ transporter protein, CorA-like/Zinc transport protein ZntB n=1 Tax=Glonium stellatum TaxID=574774 RepID=A0A8E2JW69_9PEZI|nr:hypothetical protein AOQ84DRAFT_178356 [Glonium stellatum]
MILEKLTHRLKGLLGFLFQSNWTRNATYSLAVSYQPKVRTTYAMLHGLRQDEIDKLLECLKLSEEYMWFPMLLPLLLLHYKGMCIEKDIDKCYMSIWDIELRTGMPAQALHNANAHQNTKNPIEIDSDTLTRDITSFSSEMARYQSAMDVHLPLLDSLDEITRLYLSATFHDDELDRDYIERAIRAKLAYLRTLFSGIRGRVIYHTQRAQAQRETVWSLIAQKDNLLNLRIAESTQQDSTAMKIIATITTVFLPATFTATLFSTSFFNFQPKDGTHTVSGWFWLYWIFTIVLTVIILGIWYIISLKKLRAIIKMPSVPSKIETSQEPVGDKTVEGGNVGFRTLSAREMAKKLRITIRTKETNSDIDLGAGRGLEMV